MSCTAGSEVLAALHAPGPLLDPMEIHLHHVVQHPHGGLHRTCEANTVRFTPCARFRGPGELHVARDALHGVLVADLDVVKHIRRRRGNCYLWNVSFQKQLIALAKKNSLLGPKPEDIPNISYNEFENYLDQSGKNKFSSEKIKSLF